MSKKKPRGKWVFDGDDSWTLCVEDAPGNARFFTLRRDKKWFTLREEDDATGEWFDLDSEDPEEAKLWAEKTLIERSIRNLRAFGIIVELDPEIEDPPS